MDVTFAVAGAKQLQSSLAGLDPDLRRARESGGAALGVRKLVYIHTCLFTPIGVNRSLCVP